MPAIVLLAIFLAVQSEPQAAAELGANLPAQPIGGEDLLAISVYGSPEFNRTVRVSEAGRIRLPMLKQEIEANGLLPAELESRIGCAFVREEILVDPVVTVTVAQYQSRPISVLGAVRAPLTFQASKRISLLEALARAQGLSEEAGSEILVTRHEPNAGPDVSNENVQRILVKSLIDHADADSNITLHGGEEIRVPPSGRVFVVGNVKRPGAFKAEDPDGMSVLKALAMAEGLAPYSTKQAFVYRRSGSAYSGKSSKEGAPREIAIQLQKILDRKAPDVPLEPDDILYVPDNHSRRATVTAIERAVGFATATASGILILGTHP